MIDMNLKYDNMHKNVIFYAEICINNHIIMCINYRLSSNIGLFVNKKVYFERY